MFKNSLFLKIILIFTLPALGILYFSTVLVYDKIESFNEVDGIRNNLIYLKTTENTLSSLQKERELTINLLLSKANIEQLNKQRINTNKFLESLENLKKKN